MKQAVEKALEAGWKYPEDYLDPTFWQALGKALGWEDQYCMGPVFLETNEEVYCSDPSKFDCTEWQYHWYSFTGHLIQGKSADSFFQELLSNRK